MRLVINLAFLVIGAAMTLLGLGGVAGIDPGNTEAQAAIVATACLGGGFFTLAIASGDLWSWWREGAERKRRNHGRSI